MPNIQENRVTAAPQLELIVDRPSGGALTRAYLENDPSARPFFGPHFTALDGYVLKARAGQGGFEAALSSDVIVGPPSQAVQAAYMVSSSRRMSGPLGW